MTLTRIKELQGMIAEIIDDMEDWSYGNGYGPTEADLKYREDRIQSIAHMILYSLIGEMTLAKEI